MGCVFARADLGHRNTRIFQVWNVDDNGRQMNPGKIEVTETDLILYQKGKRSIRWPLKSLRRYGFDAELFSFESGRRCPTGPGIYAFRCRLAEVLFNVLQECIQNSGGGSGAGSGSGSMLTGMGEQINLTTMGLAVTSNGSLGNGSISASTAVTNSAEPNVDSSGYLEPIIVNSQQSSMVPTNTRSCSRSSNGFVYIPPAGAVTAAGLSTSTAYCNGSTSRNPSPRYMNEELFNSASREEVQPPVCAAHEYVNSSVVAESTSQCCKVHCPRSSSDQTGMSLSSASDPSSPTALTCQGRCCSVHCVNCVDLNTNYAKLDDLLKQEQSVKRQREHFYVNVKPDQAGTCLSGPPTPTSCCLVRSATAPVGPISRSPSSRFYANVGSSPDKSGPLEKDEPKVTYIVLDLDRQSDSGNDVISPTSPASEGSLPTSPYRAPEGYATIDFDKTAALSNSSNPCAFHDDSVRKTRHNATIPCAGTSS